RRRRARHGGGAGAARAARAVHPLLVLRTVLPRLRLRPRRGPRRRPALVEHRDRQPAGRGVDARLLRAGPPDPRDPPPGALVRGLSPRPGWYAGGVPADGAWIRTPDELTALARELAGAEAVAVDTEADSLHHYPERLCLVQLGDAGGRAWLVDPLALPDLEPLRPLCAATATLKVFHGA